VLLSAIRSIIVVLGLAVALVGCGTLNPDDPMQWQYMTFAQRQRAMEAKEAQWQAESKARENADKARLEAYAQPHPEFGQTVINRQIAIGMSQEDLIASWGRPTNVNTSVSAYTTNEQWFYFLMPYLIGYEERGVKTANDKIQKAQEQSEAQPDGA